MAKVDTKGNLEKPETGRDASYDKIKATSEALALQTQGLGDLCGDDHLDRCVPRALPPIRLQRHHVENADGAVAVEVRRSVGVAASQPQ